MKSKKNQKNFTKKIKKFKKKLYLNIFSQDLVLRCIAQLVNSNQANIRSGWKNVFGVLGIAAGSDREPIVEVIYRIFNSVTTSVQNLTP